MNGGAYWFKVTGNLLYSLVNTQREEAADWSTVFCLQDIPFTKGKYRHKEQYCAELYENTGMFISLNWESPGKPY